MKDFEVVLLKEKDVNERGTELIKKWKQINGNNATLGALRVIFFDLKMQDMLDSLDSYLQEVT